MKEAAVVLLAYLVGSIPMAYVLGRAMRGIDIRHYGSGNVGASNVWTHVARWVAIPLGAFDIFFKGAFPVYLAQRLDTGLWVAVAAGLAAVAGHNWSLYLKLTGGRGITVAMGVLFILSWQVLAASLLVATGGLIFRNSALWVGIAVVLMPVWSVGFREPLPVTVLCICLVAIVALKRVMGNRGTAVPGLRWRDVLLPRLLYDRDIASRDEWVRRAPPEA
ncbi:MAG: plsY [Dehalococcoidia bacterium]|nr:plsY [Dehalococcoidia bacterium]